jgi:hypothetical protein
VVLALTVASPRTSILLFISGCFGIPKSDDTLLEPALSLPVEKRRTPGVTPLILVLTPVSKHGMP